LAAKTGWSRATIGNYLSGKTLPPTDRLDALVRLLGATAAELGRLATLRDGMEEVRRRGVSGAPPRRITGHGRVLPRQLPKPVRHLAGRRTELEALTRLAGTAVEGRTAAVVLTIGGMAGVGKTALAVFWAHCPRNMRCAAAWRRSGSPRMTYRWSWTGKRRCTAACSPAAG
jgi:transcriptional regulator with XRE-family HTH domain